MSIRVENEWEGDDYQREEAAKHPAILRNKWEAERSA
jgi:hypothetical protein